MHILTGPLHLSESDFRVLFKQLGPSLGLWRGAEIAALREQDFPPPVLDLGCGDGLVTSYVLPRAAVGLDPDSAGLARTPPGLYERLVPSTLEEAGLRPGELGCILSNSVLEHVRPLEPVLAAAAQALRPGGRLVITSPSQAFSRWLALPFASYAARRNRHLQHYNLWPLEQWQRCLDQVGLRIEQVRPYLRPGWVWAWDAIDLLESIHLRRVRPLGRLWQRLPPSVIARLASRAARLDLSALEPGGGRLIVAVK